MLPWGVKVVVIEPCTMRTPLAMGFAGMWLKSYREADPHHPGRPVGRRHECR